MKICPINRRVATTVDRFQVVGELNGYMEEAIKKLAPQICSLTHYAPIRIAQRGNTVMVNSGNITSTLLLKEMNEPLQEEPKIQCKVPVLEKYGDIWNMILDNVHKNNELRVLKKEPVIPREITLEDMMAMHMDLNA